MTFAHPQMLWLLSLSAPVILMHFYRGRRRRIPVPSLLFWDAIVLDEEFHSAFKRLRHLVSLLMILAALTLLSAAAAGPVIEGFPPAPRRVTLVIDTGPAMRATGRMEEAREKARLLLLSLGSADRAALFDMSGVVEPATTDRRRTLRALDRLPEDRPLRDRREILDAARRAAEGGALYVFSCTPGSDVVPVGRPLPNVSLSRPLLATLPQSDGTPVPRVRITATNHSDTPADAEIVLSDRGEAVDRKRLALKARESIPVDWDLNPKRCEGGALLEFSLASHDDHPDDDFATLVVPPTAPPAVTLVSAGDPDPHLLSALDVLARSGVITLHRVPDAASARGRAVVVFDGIDPDGEEPGGALIVASKGAAIDSPRIIDWSREAPFHRRVDYADVRLRRAATVTGTPLILSDKGPIAAWGSKMGSAWIRFGFSFRVEDGDFALRPAFPLMLRDAIAWLAGEGPRAFPAEAFVGEALANRRPLPVERGEARVTEVRGSGGRASTAPIERAGLSLPLLRTALLKIEVGDLDEWVAVNDPAAGTVDLTAVAGGDGPALPPPLPWWRDLPSSVVAAVAALLLLIGEWWIYRSER